MLMGCVSEEDEDGLYRFVYIHSDVPIPSDDGIWVNPAPTNENFEPESPGDLEVATLIPPSIASGSWKLDHELVGVMTMRPFICQYPIM